MPTMQVLADIMERQTRLIEGMAQGGGPTQNVRAEGHSIAIGARMVVTLEQFQKLGSPIFRRTTNPMVDEAWLKKVQKIFEAIECTNEQRVAFVSFVLQGEADHWWETRARLLRNGLGDGPITWKMFVDAF